MIGEEAFKESGQDLDFLPDGQIKLSNLTEFKLKHVTGILHIAVTNGEWSLTINPYLLKPE